VKVGPISCEAQLEIAFGYSDCNQYINEEKVKLVDEDGDENEEKEDD